MAIFEYRSDGWPLCPACGTDSLQSVEAVKDSSVPVTSRIPLRQPLPDDKMACAHCSWTGFVEKRRD
jgi:hypothetical protein